MSVIGYTSDPDSVGPELSVAQTKLGETQEPFACVTLSRGFSSWTIALEPKALRDFIDQCQEILALLELDRLLQRKAQRPKPKRVCLCGSTRFGEAFHAAALRETLAWHKVDTIGCNLKSDLDLQLAGEITEQDKEELDLLHFDKIDDADEILVLNVGGYIGPSTRREIAYARKLGKPVRYLVPVGAQEGGQSGKV